MNGDKLEARAEYVLMRDVVEIYLFEKQQATGRTWVARDVQLHEQEAGMFTGPAFQLRNAEAQVLMDDLWRAGLRPTGGAGSAGSFRAVEKHLDDMRTIAFKTLGIE